MPLLQPPGPQLRPSDLTYTDGYKSIISRVRRRGGATGSGGVVIMAGIDLDGLLAARILATLFKQDDVQYRLVPIGGYDELEVKRDEAFASDDLHTLILLSLGSLLDLSDWFKVPPGVHLHVVDAHRPWNLNNLYGVDVDVDDAGDGTGVGKLWVWGDGDEAKLEQVKKSWEALEYEPANSDSDSDSESEDEGGVAEEEETEDDESEDGEAQLGKRARKSPTKPNKRRREDDDDRPRKLPRAVRDAHLDRVNNYYSAGTSYGVSVAQTIYLLATELERADNDVLWLAILAVTNQYVSAQINRERYKMLHELLSDEVVRLNPPDSARTPDADNRSISLSSELRFVLFRHWNLYSAMLHSSYVAGQMGIWKERGQKRLQGLLAKMGYSLQQCQQPYQHMDLQLKKDLPSKLDAIAPEYGLSELEYPSFVRAFGFQMSAMSAADAVEGFSALLDAATGLRIEVEVEGGRGGGEWFGGMRTWSVGGDYANGHDSAPLEDAEIEEGKKEGQSNKGWQSKNFWIAYDAFDDVPLLRKSLPLAKALHCAIIRQGTAILDKGTIRAFPTFRFTGVKEGPDLRLFSKPAPLARLALWLIDATRDKYNERAVKKGKKVSSLPFVIAVLNEEKKTYMVVGVTGAPEYGDVRKNKFGLAFQESAEYSGVVSKNEMFDTSVLEIAAEDMTVFMEQLAQRAY